jgi:hypothetical protein
MTIEVRQEALFAYGFDTGATVSLVSPPLPGNLMIAFAAERSGATDWSITGATGWQLADANYYLPSDGTYRKSLAVWYKWAVDDAELSVTTLSNTTGPGATGIIEFQGAFEDFQGLSLSAAVSLGSSAVVSSYASGSSASVDSTDKFLVGVNTTKVGTTAEVPYDDWSTGAQSLINLSNADGGSNGVDISVAAAHSSVSGVNSVTAAKLAGTTDAERGGITALLVFSKASTPPSDVALFTETGFPLLTEDGLPILL